MAAPTDTPETYTIAMEPPLVDTVKFDGFPSDPRPAGAPKIFLDAMDVRIKVFCDEQKCPVDVELDEDDPRSWHWVAYDSKGVPVSVIRIVPPPHGPHPNGFFDPNEEPYAKLGRVATLESARGKGLSKKLVLAAFAWLKEHPNEVGHGWKGMMLTHAQLYVEKMYGKFGFVTDDRLGRWDEEGIEHLGMWNKLDVKQ